MALQIVNQGVESRRKLFHETDFAQSSAHTITLKLKYNRDSRQWSQSEAALVAGAGCQKDGGQATFASAINQKFSINLLFSVTLLRYLSAIRERSGPKPISCSCCDIRRIAFPTALIHTNRSIY